jgi:hypothetical protein
MTYFLRNLIPLLTVHPFIHYNIIVNAYIKGSDVMSLTPSKFDKEQIIDTLLQHQCFKMPDGRQLYEATESELQLLICSTIDDHYTFCSF